MPILQDMTCFYRASILNVNNNFMNEFWWKRNKMHKHKQEIGAIWL